MTVVLGNVTGATLVYWCNNGSFMIYWYFACFHVKLYTVVGDGGYMDLVLLYWSKHLSASLVSDWKMTDYLFAAGWRLFNHLLLSASEFGAVHC